MNIDLEQFSEEHLKEMLDEDINPLDGFSSVPNYWLHHFARIALSAKQGSWVKCSDRVPDSRGEFLVYETLNNRVQHDYWVPDNCAALGIGFWNHYGPDVTHWMSLPAAPKQESKL